MDAHTFANTLDYFNQTHKYYFYSVKHILYTLFFYCVHAYTYFMVHIIFLNIFGAIQI